jgi:hypothetical protein
MRECPCGAMEIDMEQKYTRFVGEVPLEVSGESPNWICIPITLPYFYKHWVEHKVDPDRVKSVPKPHITLLYGFDPAHFWQVKKVVDAYEGLGKNLEFGKVRDGDRDSVKIVGVTSPALQECFWKLHAQFPNQHFLVDGKFDPHVTLCWLKE